MIGRTNVSGDYGVGDLIAIENLKNTSRIKVDRIHSYQNSSQYYKVYNIDETSVLLISDNVISKMDISSTPKEVWSRTFEHNGAIYSKKHNIVATCLEGIDVETGSVIWSRFLPALQNGDYTSMEIANHESSYVIQSTEYPKRYVDEFNFTNGQKIKRWDNFISPTADPTWSVDKVVRVDNYTIINLGVTRGAYLKIFDSNGDLVKQTQTTTKDYHSVLKDEQTVSVYKDSLVTFLSYSNDDYSKGAFKIPSLERVDDFNLGLIYQQNNLWYLNTISRVFTINKYRINDDLSNDLIFEKKSDLDGLSMVRNGANFDFDENLNIFMLRDSGLNTRELDRFYQYLEILN